MRQRTPSSGAMNGLRRQEIKVWNLVSGRCIQHWMKRVIPFPSLSLLLPDDVAEDRDSKVVSYWRPNDTCLLQMSSFRRTQGPQVSATQRLSDRIQKGGEWLPVGITHTIQGCDIAAASTIDAEGNPWVHVYLVWEWLSVYVTVARKAEHSVCDWVWDSLLSIRPIVM